MERDMFKEVVFAMFRGFVKHNQLWDQRTRMSTVSLSARSLFICQVETVRIHCFMLAAGVRPHSSLKDTMAFWDGKTTTMKQGGQLELSLRGSAINHTVSGLLLKLLKLLLPTCP
ncbi:hypothetical protein EYF80_037016 [Liparis tanakae]|uniref:Uncharacterized protein n=1 Tax=Liparis tanakae TaxID=230148 RepID=A0A4Z2GIU0_9TELE|nr:hypothetical protein EYF80_037016 [Liparis tanakae]